ncbi:unnamed protein product [Choristocarpus tenellus]
MEAPRTPLSSKRSIEQRGRDMGSSKGEEAGGREENSGLFRGASRSPLASRGTRRPAPSLTSFSHAQMGLSSTFVNLEETMENKDDAHTLTVFPSPGDPRRRPVTQFLWDGSESEGEMAKSSGQKGRGGSGMEGMPSVNLNLKLYWMPDKLCKVCYECDTPFSMFRRRHHCRVCGQIFCHLCSSHHTDGKHFGINGFIRTCTTCSNQLQASRRAGRRAERRLSRGRQPISRTALKVL